MNPLRTHGGQIFPFPGPNETVYETPPAFLWIGNEKITGYRVTVRDMSKRVLWSGVTKHNAIVPREVFPAGQYQWNVYAEGDTAERGWQSFVIAENAVPFLRPSAGEVFNGIPDIRPRHLFCEEDIDVILKNHGAELDTLRRNVSLALSRPLPQPPQFHLSGSPLEYRAYFGSHRDVCDRDLTACALAFALLKDQNAGEYARKLLLTLCQWNPHGPCSPNGEWGDEIGLSHARCLPAVYDLLWVLLSPRERRLVEHTVAAYAGLCEQRLSRLNFYLNPGDSHCGRLPAYLGEAALVLYKSEIVPEEILKRWLSYALDIYGSVFPHYGGQDGGWAEGVFYASSYTKWYLPFFSAVARFSGKNFLDRPFYQNLLHFFIHFAPPGQENHPFGDGYWCLPDDDEWPGFFAQNPFRVYADRCASEEKNEVLALSRQFSRQLCAPDIFKLHLLDIFLPPMKPPQKILTGKLQRARAFPHAGFVSLHTHIENPAQDTVLLARASRFGSVSHQHADQGNFALIHQGRVLISPSGYFGSQYGSRHHFEWTRQTFAHNCLLIDGQPQPYDFTSTGSILTCGSKGNRWYASLDLTSAYPMLKQYIRSFELEVATDSVRLIVRDRLCAAYPVSVSYLNHTLSKPEISAEGCVKVVRGATLIITPQTGLQPMPTLTDFYSVAINEGVPPAHWVQKPPQYHLRWESGTPLESKPAETHDIAVMYDLN